MADASTASRLAVVTGGGGDIGQAIAKKLGESHDRVILVDINEARTKAVAEELGKDRFSAMTCDITNSTQVEELQRKVVEEFGGTVCTLVNNAGATWATSLQEITPEIWERETRLNLNAAFHCFHAFQSQLKQTKGTVINIASVNGLSVFGNPGYSAAKAGMIHLTQSIAVEYGKFGIRANTVAPGTVLTQAWDSRRENNPGLFEEVMQWYPLKHAVKAQDVANAVAFLSSEQAAAITGVCLPVDSGLTAGSTALPRTFAQTADY